MCHGPHYLSSYPIIHIANHHAESVNHENLLEKIEHQIAKTKEEALSRKEILEKVEKWLAASQEESWLEEYNRVGHYCDWQ